MRGLMPGLCAVVSAIPALAQPLPTPATGLHQWQVSADDGASWHSSITIDPGARYRIRGIASWTNVSDPCYGFAGLTFEQIDLIGANPTDVFGGASAPGGLPLFTTRRTLVSGEQLSLQPGASAGFLKIDNVTPTSRVNLGQQKHLCWGSGFPNPDYSVDNPIVLIEMEAVAGDAKTLTISSPWARLGSPPSNEFKIYVTACETNKKPLQEAVQTAAHVWIRPNAACIPDFNGDGLVDFADYLEFLSFYDTADFRADLNRDGLIDFSDYLDFLTAFDAGC